MTTTLEQLQYPIGRFTPAAEWTPQVRAAALDEIGALPRRIRAAVQGLDDRQLDTPYRPDGWTVRQVVHHVADSHMNGFVRVKLALTEENPTIKPYDEKAFASLGDMRLPVEVSLTLLDGLHARWLAVYASMTASQFERSFFHPELAESSSLARHAQMYAWHSRHHVAHIERLRERQGW